MNAFKVYRVSAKREGSDRPHDIQHFIGTSPAEAMQQAFATMPHDVSTSFLVAESHEYS
jgi:hypothetical protein